MWFISVDCALLKGDLLGKTDILHILVPPLESHLLLKSGQAYKKYIQSFFLVIS